ncbi:hypothetical protein GOP47_0010200 [Adiantum capillus-veneris]|uniref:Bacterial surface antigen (D15) domain-containing protein n=1 Tax=Adiantum capillus-veneris TaxID=13818 RepID=A0A9D4UUB3_ADICA|nr:hypothetical protein GOP47_0010200 [Adiantum capillus-veneris]
MPGHEWRTAAESVNDEEDGGQSAEFEEEGDLGVSADEFELMFKRFAQEEIPLRVLEVKVEGNRRTRSSVIQDHIEPLKKAETTRQLLREAAHAVERIEHLGLFRNFTLALETGPVQGSVIVVLYVEEAPRPFSVNLTSFSAAKDARSAFGGSFRWKNVLGYGETWDATCSYGWDEDSDLTAGIHLPWFGRLSNHLAARVAVHVPEWLNFSSYKVGITGVTIGFSDKHHDLSYNVTWKPLQDDNGPDAPTLLPALKYSFKVDHRDSVSRPRRGYAFKFATQVVGGSSDLSRHSARQDVDFRLAIPLSSSFNGALNFGLSGGIMLPWTKDYQKSIFSSDRFFVGRHSSLVSEMNGPTTILNLISRGLNKAKPKKIENGKETSGFETGFKGNLAATGFADLSFDLPWGGHRKQSLYGHCFICAGNLVDLSEPGRASSRFQSFMSSLRCFVGAGIVFPTQFVRLEVNFCQMLGSDSNHGSKRGVQIGFSSPG